MLSPEKIIESFAAACTACGLCVEVCPIVSETELKDAAPGEVMDEILELFRHGKTGPLARSRIYSCLFCNTCVPACPLELNPGFTFGTAKGLLRKLGEAQPKGVAGIMDYARARLEESIISFRARLTDQTQLITDLHEKPKPARTVLYATCFGLMQGQALYTTLKIMERIDPGVRVLGGYDFCCGELQFLGGRPAEARHQFAKLVEGLSAFSPVEVVIFCPTCKMTFDHHRPQTNWSWSFVTDYIADHLNELGPPDKIDANVTLHDSCHYVRGIEPATDSPRKILAAIPGVQISEMKNKKMDALCCGGYAITGTGGPGYRFRDRRLAQAGDTGADLLGVYCPGCHMTLGAGAAQKGLETVSILSLLGKSLGIEPAWADNF